MPYEFRQQLIEGEQYAKEQDAFYGTWFDITDVNISEDRRGIDRYFAAKKCPLRFSVQYKGDQKASSTGNLFIEIISVDTDNTPGWALQCDADYLSIYVPSERVFYWISVPLLKACIPFWLIRYDIGQSPNPTYKTHGLKVPRKVIEVSPCCYGLLKAGIIATRNQMSMFSDPAW